MRTLLSFKFSSLKHFSVSVATGLVLLHAHSAYADTKIADTTANLGSTTAARTPDAVLEVVGGTFNATAANAKPSFMVRSADSAGTSGTAGSGTPSLIVTQPASAGAAGNVGIGTAAPITTLDVVGTAIKLPSNITATCDATLPGAIRYNTTLAQMQYCNGTSWQALASGNAPVYQLFSPTTNQTVTGSGYIVNYHTATPLVSSGAGGVTYNVATRTFTLPANRTFRIDFNSGWVGFNNGNWGRIQLFDNTTNTAISTSAHFESTTSTAAVSNAPTLVHFVAVGATPLVINVQWRGGNTSNATMGDVTAPVSFSTIAFQSID